MRIERDIEMTGGVGGEDGSGLIAELLGGGKYGDSSAEIRSSTAVALEHHRMIKAHRVIQSLAPPDSRTSQSLQPSFRTTVRIKQTS